MKIMQLSAISDQRSALKADPEFIEFLAVADSGDGSVRFAE